MKIITFRTTFLRKKRRIWFNVAEILQHQKLERTTLCSILRLRLFIFRREADKRRRSRLLFLRPQNAAQPHFSAVKMKSETVKLNIKWSARAFGAAKFPQRLNKISIVKNKFKNYV